MKKRGKALLSRPNESIWQLANFALTESVPLLNHRLATIAFADIESSVLDAPEFSDFDYVWRTQTRNALLDDTLTVVVPAMYEQGEVVSIFIILPIINNKIRKEHWGREILSLSFDKEFMMRTLVKNR